MMVEYFFGSNVIIFVTKMKNHTDAGKQYDCMGAEKKNHGNNFVTQILDEWLAYLLKA